MFDDIRSIHDRAPVPLKLMQWTAWVVGVAVLIHIGNLSKSIVTPKPVLTAVQLSQAEALVDQTIQQAKATGRGYTMALRHRDASLFIDLEDRLGRFRGPEPQYTRVQNKAQAAMSATYELLTHNLEEDYAASLPGGKSNPQYQHGVSQYVSQMSNDLLIPEGLNNHVARQFNFLPTTDNAKPFDFGALMRRWMIAWFWTLFPALGCILLRSRGRMRHLLAELYDRPWSPVCSTVFWWFGAYNYRPQSSTERLEVAERKSRMALATATLCATLTAPISLLCQVATAFAQTMRATGLDSSMVDTTRIQRRRLNGFVDGNVETASDGRRLTVSSHLRGKLVLGDDGLFVHLNPITATPIEAYAFTNSGNTQVMGGLVVPYAVFDYPAPWNALFPFSQGFDLLPSFGAFGMQGETRAGPMTLQAGVLSDDLSGNRQDVELRTSAGRGIFSGAASYQGGSEHQYTAANLSVAGSAGSLSYEFAHRSDKDPDLAGSMHQVELVGQHGSWRTGVQLASAQQGTLQVSLERTCGGFKRILLNCLLQPDQAPQWKLGFQQGVTLATP